MSAVSDDECQEVLSNLSELTERQFALLKLRVMGFSLAEQQEKLKVSNDALRQLWRRTREKLGIPSAYSSGYARAMQRYHNCLQLFNNLNAQITNPAVTSTAIQIVESDLILIEPLPQRALVVLTHATSKAIEHDNLRELLRLGEDPSRSDYFREEWSRVDTRRRNGLLILILASLLTVLIIAILLVLTGIISYRLGSTQSGLAASEAQSFALPERVITVTVVVIATPIPSIGATTATSTSTISKNISIAANGCTIVMPFAGVEPLRSEGVSQFTPANTSNGVLGNKIRTLLIDKRGVIAGYFEEKTHVGGVGINDKIQWYDCKLPKTVSSLNINKLAVDQQNQLWVATEKDGVWMFNGRNWMQFGEVEGLTSQTTYDIIIGPDNSIWAATYDGIFKYDGSRWSHPYRADNKTLITNPTHAIMFDSAGNLWIGYIDKGISVLRKSTGKWEYYGPTEPSDHQIDGTQIRAFAIQPAVEKGQETVWVATADAGVLAFQGDRRISYRSFDGLPSEQVIDIAIDHYGRPWIATNKGVAFLSKTRWEIYHTLPANTVRFGPACQTLCPWDEEFVWTGLVNGGLTASRLPFNEETVDYIEHRFYQTDGKEISSPVFRPGEKFRLEVSVRPRLGYLLKEARGDALWLLNDTNNRYGGFSQMILREKSLVIEGGQTYNFTDYDNLFTAPNLPDNTNEAKFVLRYRVWMWGRASGPIITIEFIVKR